MEGSVSPCKILHFEQIKRWQTSSTLLSYYLKYKGVQLSWRSAIVPFQDTHMPAGEVKHEKSQPVEHKGKTFE